MIFLVNIITNLTSSFLKVPQKYTVIKKVTDVRANTKKRKILLKIIALKLTTEEL